MMFLTISPLITFKGYTEDIKIAERINKQVHQMNLTSSTHLLRRREERERAPITKSNLDFISLLNKKIQETGELIVSLRDEWEKYYIRAKTYEKYIQRLLKDINMHKVANCGEMTDIAQYLLLQKGVHTDKIHFKVLLNNGNRRSGLSDHTILVMRMDQNADPSAPNTWGNEAIIIDPWFGIAKRAKPAMKQLKELMKVDTKNHKLVFSRLNYSDKVTAWRKYC